MPAAEYTAKVFEMSKLVDIYMVAARKATGPNIGLEALGNKNIMVAKVGGLREAEEAESEENCEQVK
jgi:hypothetical protein